jgi:hypothetical protein
VAVTAARARKLALSLEGATEAPHFDRAAFRTPRKIFATLAKSGADINLMFDSGLQEFYCEQTPKAFAPVPGGWGRMGATRCDSESGKTEAGQAEVGGRHISPGACAMRTPRCRRASRLDIGPRLNLTIGRSKAFVQH